MLTDDDLRKIANLLTSSGDKLAVRIDTLEGRVEARVRSLEQRLEARITETIAASEQRLHSLIAETITASEQRLEALVDGKILASEERMAILIAAEIGSNHTSTQAAIQSAIEASENRLLIAFNQWASPVETKVRAHSMAIGAFDGEKQNSIEQAKKIAELERRIEKLEKAS